MPRSQLFNETSSQYDKLRKSLDTQIKELTSQGYEYERKSANGRYSLGKKIIFSKDK